MLCCFARPLTADSGPALARTKTKKFAAPDHAQDAANEVLIGTAVQDREEAAVSDVPGAVAESQAGQGESSSGATQPLEAPGDDLQEEGSAESTAPLLKEAAAAGEGQASGASSGVQEAGNAAIAAGSGMQEAGNAAGAAEALEVDGSLSSQQGHTEASASVQEHASPVDLAEGSQEALLPPAEDISLKQPRFSRLSNFLSGCTTSHSLEDSGERHSKTHQLPQQLDEQQRQEQQQQQQQDWPPELEFDAAAADLVLLPRAKLLPLAAPEQALADAAGLLGRQEVPVLLTALLTLRRVAIHHPQLLAESLEDVSQVLLECMQGGDVGVCQAAVMSLLDLLVSFGSGMLRYFEYVGGMPQYSCLLGLLVAASRGRTPAIRFWANEALRYIAERLNQSRVIRALERYLEHDQAHVRNKAAEWLMVATYRPPDSGVRSRPTSPNKGWQS